MERLFGVETEYAFTALNRRRMRISPGNMMGPLIGLARQRLTWLPDGTQGGVFLQNGARLYIDAGCHPEFSTPECANPWDLVRYVQAGECILADLARALETEEREVSETSVLRSNVDYSGSRATWGCHESYLHRQDPQIFPDQIIPHLVSRIIYTGAGGFNSLQPSGLEFTLSPRVWHLTHEVSGESTQNRGIFHTKNESLSSSGYSRLHILCGESLCSELASWLKIGTTALVVALIDAGVRPGDGVHVWAPLTAMREFAGDPTCSTTAKLHDGTRLSALDIQRHYLSQAEEHLHRDFMPPFAQAVCERWRAILDALGGAPESVATQLDWAIKFLLYTDRARRQGIAWESIPSWGQVVAKLAELHASQAPRGGGRARLDLNLATHLCALRPPRELVRFLREHDLRWESLATFVKLQKELFEIDTCFGQLGDRGIFTLMDRDGVLAHHVAGVDNIAHAVENPPAIGRARVRGESVRKIAGELNARERAGERDRYITAWERIWDCERRQQLDLSDPFLTKAPEWKEIRVDEDAFVLTRLHRRESLLSRLRAGLDYDRLRGHFDRELFSTLSERD